MVSVQKIQPIAVIFLNNVASFVRLRKYTFDMNLETEGMDVLCRNRTHMLLLCV